jgi:hypothetical protein
MEAISPCGTQSKSKTREMLLICLTINWLKMLLLHLMINYHMV